MFEKDLVVYGGEIYSGEIYTEIYSSQIWYFIFTQVPYYWDKDQVPWVTLISCPHFSEAF